MAQHRKVASAKTTNWVEGFQLDEIGPGYDAHKWITDKMHKSIAVHNNTKISKYNIVKVYQVKNSSLWDKYTARRQEIAGDFPRGERVPEMRLFHGTLYADNIVKNGFNVKYSKEQGMFGKGIYFADLSSKSSQYTFEGCNSPCRQHSVVHCTSCIRKMLICKVALGKTFQATSPMNGILAPPRGYHSIVANPGPGFLNYPEYIVHHNDQAFPSYMIEYKISF